MNRTAALGAGALVLAAGSAALLLRPSPPGETVGPAVAGAVEASAPRLRGDGPGAPRTVGLSDDDVRAMAHSFLEMYGDEARARLAILARTDARVAAALVDDLRPERDGDEIRPGIRYTLDSRLGWIRKILVDLGAPAVEALRKAVVDPDAEMRVRVVNTLRLFGADAAPAAPALVAALETDGREPYERVALYYAVAAVGPDARGALPRALAVVANEDAAEDEASAAIAAVIALAGPGETAFEAARTVLARRALGAGIEVLLALHEMGPQAAPMVPAVLDLLEQTTDGPLAQHGLATLHAIASGDAKSIELLHDAVVDEGRSDEYRQLAAHALAAQGEAGRAALLRQAEIHGEEVRLLAFVALLPTEGHADEALVRMVLPSVRSDDRVVRGRALSALSGRVAVAAWVLPALRDALRDEVPGTQMGVTMVLQGLPEPDAEALAIAADLSVEGRPWERGHALAAVREHATAAPDTALACLRRAFADRDLTVRYAAVEAATSLRFHRRVHVIALWADAAKDSEAAVRELATQRLKDLGVAVPAPEK